MINGLVIGISIGFIIGGMTVFGVAKRALNAGQRALTELLLTRKEMGRLGKRIGTQRRKMRAMREELQTLRPPRQLPAVASQATS